MAFIDFKDSELYVENLQAKELAAEYGTPLYVYSKGALSDRFNAFEDALKSKSIRYALRSKPAHLLLYYI